MILKVKSPRLQIFLSGPVLALMFLVTNTAQAGLIITDDIHYLQRAQLYPEVGWMYATKDGDSGRASGVLIHPNWVLASAHQVTNNSTSHVPYFNSYTFGFGSNALTNPGETKTASEMFIHPTYSGAGQSGYDLAMFYFPDPFTSITPAELALFHVTPGMDSDIVGFGNLQFVNDPNVSFTGDRRAGNNVTANDAGFPAEYSNTRLRDASFSTFKELGMAGRNGDSGGGLFINGQLAGIISTGNPGNSFGVTTRYARLDHQWIQSTIDSRSVPEPSSFFLFAMSSLGLGFFRKKNVC